MRPLPTVTKMFTQTSRINTNKCNGCKKHCELDAVFYNKKKQGFLPTISGHVIKYYTDKNGTKHCLHLYATRYNAIDAAKVVIKTCKRYTEKFSTIYTNDPNTCAGCQKMCKLGTKQEANGILPTINNHTIHGYIDAHGCLQVTQPQQTIASALQIAKRIAERCDFYKKQQR